MNNFKRISAVILALCTVATLFYSCSEKEGTTDVSSTKTANGITENINAEPSAAVITENNGSVSVNTPTATKNEDIKTTKPAVITAATTKKRPVVDDKINEKAVGIFMLSKTDPVQVGTQATIFIQGTPGKTYSIDFYETPSSTVKIEEKKADANGFVSWSIKIKNTCNLGKRKVVIKENNSDNYLETSITVK